MRWSVTSSVGEPDFSNINLQVQFLEEKLFCDYEPTKGPHPEFWARFENWIENFGVESDQKTAFQIIPKLFYVGQEEFHTLYRVAANGSVARWLINILNLMFDTPDAERQLREAFAKTWFCPITDSMRINSFYHLNGIRTGHDLRSDWLSLSQIGNADTIKRYIQVNGIDYIVLLEDFVGSGSQISDAVSYAASLANDIGVQVLLLPIIVCPKGVSTFNSLATAHSNLSVNFVIELQGEDFISATPVYGEEKFSTEVRALAVSTYDKVRGHSGPWIGKPYTPFGYKSTGGLVVMFSNCPDNTLPFIHHNSSSWNPLFPRSSRI